jgi:hypothetical protein
MEKLGPVQSKAALGSGDSPKWDVRGAFKNLPKNARALFWSIRDNWHRQNGIRLFGGFDIDVCADFDPCFVGPTEVGWIFHVQ